MNPCPLGVSLEGSVIITRSDANTKMYGRSVTAKELLNGTVPPPPEADALYRALGAKFHTLGNTAASYRRGDLDENGNDQGTGKVYRSTTISKPGTLKRPPAVTAQARSPPPPAYHHQPAAHSYGKMEPPQPSSPPTRTMMPSSAPAPSPPPVAPRRPMPPPVKPREPVARALYPYQGEQPGDLSFEEGQVIVIVEKTDSQDDWWTGKIGNQTGVVSTFVEWDGLSLDSRVANNLLQRYSSQPITFSWSRLFMYTPIVAALSSMYLPPRITYIIYIFASIIQ